MCWRSTKSLATKHAQGHKHKQTAQEHAGKLLCDYGRKSASPITQGIPEGRHSLCNDDQGDKNRKANEAAVPVVLPQ